MVLETSNVLIAPCVVQIEQLQLLIFPGPSGAKASARVTVYLIIPQWQLAVYVFGIVLVFSRGARLLNSANVQAADSMAEEKV